MMPVAIYFHIPHRKKAQEYFVRFFDYFETSKQTTDVMYCVRNKRSVYYSDCFKLIKYYLVTGVFECD